MFQGWLKGISMKCQGCFVQALMIGKFKGVSRNIRSLSRKIKGCFEGVLRVYQGYLKEVLRRIQRSL